MGQYYLGARITEKNIDGESRLNLDLYSPWRADSGLKLMEFAYIGDTFADAMTNLARESPPWRHGVGPDGVRLALIGDYAEEGMIGKGHMTDWELCNARDAIRIANSSYGWMLIKDIPATGLDLSRDRLCAIDRDMGEYVRLYGLHKEEWGGTINPLMLLIAVGNGQGGGDYVGANKDMAGRWAFHRIVVVPQADLDADPGKYGNPTLIDPGFTEDRRRDGDEED